jgi:PAS domain S-box-containing protein
MPADPDETPRSSGNLNPGKPMEKLKQRLWNLFAGGLSPDTDLETLRKIFLLNSMIFTGGIFLVLLSTAEFIMHDYCLGVMNSVFFLFIACLFLYLRKTKDHYRVSLIGITICGFFFLSLTAYGGIGKTTYLWSFTYPLLAVFLTGARKGSFFALGLLLMTVVIFSVGSPFFASYDKFIKIRFVPAYLTIYLLAFIMERTRETIHRRFNKAASALEETIAELQTTNAALAESDKQYRQIFESIQDVYYRTALDGEILTISPSVREVMGYDCQELIGRSIIESYADPSQREAIIKEMIKTGRVINYELTLMTKDGRRIISSITGRLIYNDRGEPEGFAGVMRDITERKQNAEALKRSEKRYRLLAENITDNLWTFNLKTMRLTYLSPSVRHILGYTSEEATGFGLQDILTPDSLESAMTALAEEMAEARRSHDPARSRTLEVEQIRKDGTTVWTEASVRFIYDSNNQPVSLLGVTRDITKRKMLRDQLEKSRKMESLGLLAGGVAHDLNNVLSGIVSYPELILMNLPPDSKLKKPLETMRESGLRAAAIVQDLLTIARGVATANEPLNINEVVKEYLSSPESNMIRQHYPDVVMDADLADDLLNISASPVHIRKVVMNLVSNAAEAIKKSGRVVISTENRCLDTPIKGYETISPGEFAVLSISDDGSGISANDLERIFEPFYTKKKMGRSGTGLGLSVVWNVVKDHKGYVDVRTAETGSTFDLYFPITRDALLQKAPPLSMSDYKGNGETVLVVDDVESQREISCKILETLGYKSVSVRSGEAAVAFLEKNRVDLVILDMIMDPGINGHQTYRRIINIHPGQKAIIVSGYSETDDVKKTQALGAGQYIKKPLTIEKIGLAVKEALGGH